MKVRTLREFDREQAHAALRVSGADRTSWNGRLRDTTQAEGDVRGVADWDGTIAYNPTSVSEPLDQMFQYARHHNQDPATLDSYKSAVKTRLHENTHMLAAAGSDHRQAQHAYLNGSGAKQIEEGVTELFSQQELNNYIDDLGLEEIAPGIKKANAAVAYKKYLPAVQNIADTIGRDSGLGREQVVRQLASVTADQKFRTAAGMIYDSSDLPGIVPSEQRDAAVSRIAAAMGPEFAKVEGMDTSDPDRVRRQSALVGARTMNAARGAVRELRQEWSGPVPDQQVRRGLGAEQNRGPGLDPPGGGQTDHGEARSGPAEHAGGPSLPPDLAAAARIGLGNSMPLQSASRLSTGQQGARQPGGDVPNQQRRGPETHR